MIGTFSAQSTIEAAVSINRHIIEQENKGATLVVVVVHCVRLPPAQEAGASSSRHTNAPTKNMHTHRFSVKNLSAASIDDDAMGAKMRLDNDVREFRSQRSIHSGDECTQTQTLAHMHTAQLIAFWSGQNEQAVKLVIHYGA